MKKIFLAALTCATTTAFAQKANFSGTYKVNEEKVNWGPAPKYILPRYFKVEQQQNRIIIARTPLNAQLQEQTPVVDTISFDGAAFNKKTPSGNTVANNLKWTNDQVFVLTRKTTNSAGQVTGTATETWSLENGGKTLFVNRDVEQGTMKYTTKAYFEKQ